MSIYIAHAKPWKRGWELHIEGVGVTQAKNLREAPAMAADYIELATGKPTDPADITIIRDIGSGLEQEAALARRAVADAENAQKEAAARSRGAASSLKKIGLTGRDIAVVLGISPQRVSQLLDRHSKRRQQQESDIRANTNMRGPHL